MEQVYSFFSTSIEWLIRYSILAVELVGVVVLLYAVGRTVYDMVRRRPYVRLRLAEGIALSLEFKMGGELLRTALVRDWRELLILGAVILLRAAMTFLIQWEIRNEKKNRDKEDTEKNEQQ